MWRSSFLVNFQSCRLIAGNVSNMNSFTDIFQQHLTPLPIPPPPLMFSAPVGNFGISAHLGDRKFCWEWNFYVVVGITVILNIQTLFKAKKQHFVKIPPVVVKMKFCREEEENFFNGWWKFEVRDQVIEYNRTFFKQKFYKMKQRVLPNLFY